jgi:predicted dehydrogenase
MNKVRVGVVGAGAIGENHIRVLSALENADLTAVFESNPERAREIQERYGVPIVDSLDALIDKVDAATVATPTVSHLEVGSRLLRAGRHVLVEKPIADTTEAARELVQLSNDSIRFCVNWKRR